MELVDREAVVELLLVRQRELCPLGLNRRSCADNKEEWDAIEVLIDEINALPVFESKEKE